jgi:TIGR03009 family protein
MRAYLSALVSALIVCAAAGALQPLAPPTPDRLDRLLRDWEKAWTDLQSFSTRYRRTDVDKVFQETRAYEGTLEYIKPNLVMLHTQRNGKPEAVEKLVFNGKSLYTFHPGEKEIRRWEWPGLLGQYSTLLMLGVNAEEAKRRFDLKLVEEDQDHLKLEVRPRLPADRADFQVAWLWLRKNDFLPGKLWFRQPNGNEMTWDYSEMKKDVPLVRSEFISPTVPPGWRLRSVDLPGVGKKEPAGPPKP